MKYTKVLSIATAALAVALPSFSQDKLVIKGSDTLGAKMIPKIAEAWAALMAELGYARYFAQGGDWGAIVTSTIGATDPVHCAGIHINMIVVPPDPSVDDLTELEKSAIEAFQYYQDWDSGYSKQQSTRPQTLGYGLVGVT